MQKPVRYYIVKTDDQPVVRSVAVAVSGPAGNRRPAAAPVSDRPEAAPAASAPAAARRGPRRSQGAREGVARLMRAAIRRNLRGR